MGVTQTATFLFTDLVGSTALASSLAPADADAVRRAHFEQLRGAVEATGGREVKNLGDGLMVVFMSPSRAVACAVAMQQAIERHGRRSSLPLTIRIGLATGEAVEENDDFFGEPVVEAARLCGAARGGQILATELVRLTLGRHAAQEFSSVGPLSLKGLPEPTPVVEVLWEPATAPSSSSPVPLPARLLTGGAEGLFAFFGRQDEFDRIESALKAAASGGGLRIVLVAGEPGMGKTTLAAKAARTAHAAGSSVAYGYCQEGLAIPYQPWISALAHLVEHGPEEALETLRPAHAAALTALLPATGRLRPTHQGVADSDTDRLLRLDAIAALLAGMGSLAPVVLVLDDLQWADAASLQVLQHLVLSDPALPLLVLATYRDTDLSRIHPLTSLLATLRREAAVERIELGGLSDHDVVELIETAAGYDIGEEGLQLAHAVRRETDGNPFFVTEILRHLSETGAITESDPGRYVLSSDFRASALPGSVREVIGERAARLGEDVVRTLAAAAVLGREFEVSVLSDVIELEDEALLQSLELAARAALVEETEDVPGRFRFVHALIQHTLYHDLGPTRRQRLHERAAQVIEALGAGGHVAELAHHWMAATRPTDLARAVDYARRAGDAALADLAPDDAVSWYRQALDLLDRHNRPDERQRCRVLIGLAAAQSWSGAAEQWKTLKEAGRLALSLGDPDLLTASALGSVAGLTSMSAADPERIQLIEAALDSVGETPQRAQLLAALAEETDPREWQRRDQLNEDAVEAARRSGDEVVLLSVISRNPVLMASPANIDRSLALAREAVALADRIGGPAEQLSSRDALILLLLTVGDIGGYDAILRELIDLADANGLAVFEWMSHMAQSLRHLLAGDATAAEASAEAALKAGLRARHPVTMAVYGAQLYRIRYEQGRIVEVEDVLVEAMNDNPTIPVIRTGVGRIYCCTGRLDQARSLHAEDLATGWADLPFDMAWLSGVAQAADTTADLGEMHAAEILFDRMRPYANLIAMNTTTLEGALARPMARLAAVLGRLDESAQLFELALEEHRNLEAPFWIARTELDWIASSMSHGVKVPGYKPMLDEAVECADAHGYRGLLAQAKDLEAVLTRGGRVS